MTVKTTINDDLLQSHLLITQGINIFVKVFGKERVFAKELTKWGFLQTQSLASVLSVPSHDDQSKQSKDVTNK